MTSDRMRRVDEAIRRVIGDALTGEIKDPRVGFVTVTAVKTSPDLSHCQVYVSVLGKERRREESMAGLDSAHGYLQRRVAKELRLKFTPELKFHCDEVTDSALRIEELLRESEQGR